MTFENTFRAVQFHKILLVFYFFKKINLFFLLDYFRVDDERLSRIAKLEKLRRGEERLHEEHDESVLEDHKKLYCKGKERKEPSPDPAFICFACQQTFKYKKNLLEHIRNVHPSEDAPIYDCSQCPYRARAKKNLSRHIQRMHPLEDGPSYNCVECSYSTKIKEYFSEHLRNSLHMQ